MPQANERSGGFYVKTHLLLDLALQGPAHVLAGLDLAAGELPPVALVRVRRAQGHQHLARGIADHGHGDMNRRAPGGVGLCMLKHTVPRQWKPGGGRDQA
jgi:hypothetical protein